MSRRAVTYVKRNLYTRDRCIYTPLQTKETCCDLCQKRPIHVRKRRTQDIYAYTHTWRAKWTCMTRGLDMSRRAVTYVKRNLYTRDRCMYTPSIHQRNWFDVLYVCMYIYIHLVYNNETSYGVPSIRRLLRCVRLFCKRALERRPYSAKETFNSKEPTGRSHPICVSFTHVYVCERDVYKRSMYTWHTKWICLGALWLMSKETHTQETGVYIHRIYTKETYVR